MGAAIDLFGLKSCARAFWPLQLLLVLLTWWMLTSSGYGGSGMVLTGSGLVGLCMGPTVIYVAVALGAFPVQHRGAGFGVAYNVAMLVFAAPAPIVNNAVHEILYLCAPNLPKHIMDTLAPSLWTLLGLLVAGFALVGSSASDSAYAALDGERERTRKSSARM